MLNLAEEIGNISRARKVLRILTDRGTEYYGWVDQHNFQPYLAINNINLHQEKSDISVKEWNLWALPQNDIKRVLSGHI